MTATTVSLREMARAALLERDRAEGRRRVEQLAREGEVLYRLMVERLGFRLDAKPSVPEVEHSGLRFRVRLSARGQSLAERRPAASEEERYQLHHWELSAAYVCQSPEDETFVPIADLADVGSLIEANEGPLSDIPF